MGSNAREAHPIFFHHVLKGVPQGARLYATDLRRTTSAQWADAWLGIHVGSDISLANAIGREMIEAGLVNQTFVERARLPLIAASRHLTGGGNRASGLGSGRELGCTHEPGRVCWFSAGPAFRVAGHCRLLYAVYAADTAWAACEPGASEGWGRRTWRRSCPGSC